MKKPMRVFVSVFALSLYLVGFGALGTGVSQALPANEKISPRSTSITIDDSRQWNIDFVLDEPIICNPSSLLPCSVGLDFTSSIPAGVSVSPSSIQWAPNEWNVTKTLTLSVTDLGAFTFDQIVRLTAIAVSGSEFYAGYTVTIDLTVRGTQTPTSTTTSPDHVSPAFTG